MPVARELPRAGGGHAVHPHQDVPAEDGAQHVGVAGHELPPHADARLLGRQVLVLVAVERLLHPGHGERPAGAHRLVHGHPLAREPLVLQRLVVQGPRRLARHGQPGDVAAGPALLVDGHHGHERALDGHEAPRQEVLAVHVHAHHHRGVAHGHHPPFQVDQVLVQNGVDQVHPVEAQRDHRRARVAGGDPAGQHVHQVQDRPGLHAVAVEALLAHDLGHVLARVVHALVGSLGHGGISGGRPRARPAGAPGAGGRGGH